MLRFLTASVSQGSADAFAEAEFQTGLSNVTRTAYRIRRIEWIFPALVGADCYIDMALRRNSSAALSLNLGNAGIAGARRSMELVTSGMAFQDLFTSVPYSRDEELLIVEESLFLQLDSNGTSATNTGYIRIGYETRSITENERLSIQAATASS